MAQEQRDSSLEVMKGVEEQEAAAPEQAFEKRSHGEESQAVEQEVYEADVQEAV